MTLSITSAVSMSATPRWPRSFMRSVWKPVNALATRRTWSASAFAWSAQAELSGLPDGLAVGDGLGLWDGDAVGLPDGVGDADWLAEALGLGLAWVTVMVVTPFAADTVTSAPVAP